MSSENEDYFTLAFPIRMFFSSGLTVLTRISSTILTAIGQSEKLCFFPPILGGKHYLLSLSIMLPVGFLVGACIRLRKFPSIANLLRVLITNEY